MAALDEVTKYSPKELLPTVENTKADDLFLRGMIVSGEEYSDSTSIEFDKVEHSNHAAVYRSRLGGPNEVGEQGFETVTHCIPYLFERKTYQPEEFLDRLPGELVGAGVSVASRMDQKIVGGAKNLNDRFDMAEELQVKEALETGKVVVAGDNVSYTVDFKRDTSLTVVNAPGSKWSDAGTDKLKQIGDLCKAMEALGFNPDEAIMPSDTAAALLADEAIIKLLDTRNYDIGQIELKNMREKRASYLGRLKTADMDLALYAYRGTYTDNNDTVQPVLTSNGLVIRDTSTKWKMHYGMISNFNSGNFKGKRFGTMGITEDGRKAQLTFESGPLIQMLQPNSAGFLATEG